MNIFTVEGTTMTDIEMTKLCGDAMGYQSSIRDDGTYGKDWNPLERDAQAMALVKKFRLDVTNFFGFDDGFHEWRVRGTVAGWETSGSKDVNRAIVECVANMGERT